MWKKITVLLSLIILSPPVLSQARIDTDVIAVVKSLHAKNKQLAQSKLLSVLIFLQSKANADLFIKELHRSYSAKVQKLVDSPILLVSLPAQLNVLYAIASKPSVKQISSFHGAQEELEISEQAILLRSSDFYPTVNNWWANGFTGKNLAVGILDSGVALENPNLANKQILVRKERGSTFDQFINGVRSAHGTGIACIYAGSGSSTYPNDTGLAPDTQAIVAALITDHDGLLADQSITFSSIDWMLNRAEIQPNIINYSNGNGVINCTDCNDWSGFARMIDFTINRHQILWVKSAGNNGYIPSSKYPPYASTMTIPADNYNGLTVANMDPVVREDNEVSFNPDREKHSIRYTSSRGPTLAGRKKPDIAAPGNDTRTCAPDPLLYFFKYTEAMDYHDGYRLMGGTSSATPHVGAVALLLHDSGITAPRAKKALLLNSADAYTDSDKPGPEDPKYIYLGGHYPVMGTQWNRTYGWGYLNAQKAFEQRRNLVEDVLTVDDPVKIYHALLPVGAKVTLVHERRVGYNEAGEWKLSHLSLEIIDQVTNKIIMRDSSTIDTVHQVANCERQSFDKYCSANTKPVNALIKVRLFGKIDGARAEPFALAASVDFHA